VSKLDQLKALGDAKRAARDRSGRSLGKGATLDLARVGKGESQRAEQRPSKTAPVKRGRGRPKVEGQRPWQAEGISRASWYRRRLSEQRERDK
jgi:hypothetical protein